MLKIWLPNYRESPVMELLDLLRHGKPNGRERVAFFACKSGERGTFDANEETRHRVLLELQYDRRTSDEGLVRYLFTQEVAAAENDSFQGFGHSYTLAAILLASYRNPEDVPIFARAKMANFDTVCGFPLEFMHIAGGVEAEAVLEREAPSLSEALREHFDGEGTLQSDLEEWWASINEEYPEARCDESPLALYERALAFKDEGLARRHLERWAQGEPDTRPKRSKLKYEYERLGDYARAAEVATALESSGDTSWDRASALIDVVRLNRLASRESDSFEATRRLARALEEFSDWVGVGLGRSAIHELFQVALDQSDKDFALEAFVLADSLFQRSRDLAYVGLESAVKAALRCDLTEKAAEYERLAATERVRIDAMLDE